MTPPARGSLGTLEYKLRGVRCRRAAHDDVIVIVSSHDDTIIFVL
jgi:hypothetical protein